MQIPLQVSFRDISHSDFVERRIFDKVEKLKKYSKKITSCRVIVATPHRQRTKGTLYHVSIDLRLPGEKIVVARDPDNHSHENVYIAIRDAFEAARRQLKKLLRQKRVSNRRTTMSAKQELV
jgi:putative sigma-54 modulation protein